MTTELEADIPAINMDPLSLVSRFEASFFLYPVSEEQSINVFNKLKNNMKGFLQFPVKNYKSRKNIHSSVISPISNYRLGLERFLNTSIQFCSCDTYFQEGWKE